MKKIFTLVSGLLLMSASAVQAQEPAFPESFKVSVNDNSGIEVSQGMDVGVYTIKVTGETQKAGLTLTVEVPEGWSGFFNMTDVNTDPGIAPFATRANEAEWVPVSELEQYGLVEGNTMTFPADGLDHVGQFYLYQGDLADMANQIVVEFTVENPSYQSVIDQINDLTNEFQDACEQLTNEYPDADLSEWKEIIGGQLEEYKTYAQQCLYACMEDDEEFFFPFDAEYFESMIAEMEFRVALPYKNQQAYEETLAQIEAYRTEFYTEYNKMEEQYAGNEEALDDLQWYVNKFEQTYELAKIHAMQNLEYANEWGEEYFQPYDLGELAYQVEDVKNIPLYMAYDKVLEQFGELRTELQNALTEIHSETPDFDTTAWETAIDKEIEQAEQDASNAYFAALYEGAPFTYEVDVRKFSNMIETMIAASKGTTGINGIEAEVAAGKAQIFTLDGKQHKAPVKGEVNVIVRENSTSKVYINK